VKQWLETRQVLEAIGAATAAPSLTASRGHTPVAAALATVVRVRGSAYRHEGAKLLVTADSSHTGNVSGGCLEEDVREVALRVIRTGVAERRSYCGSADEIAAWDLGVGCEGEVDILVAPVRDPWTAERDAMRAQIPFVVLTALESGARRCLTGADAAALIAAGDSRLETIDGVETFVDVLTPPPRLLVVSGGDDARHLVRIAHEVGFRVVVADRRPGLLQPERFPVGVQIVETDAARLGERVVLEPHDFAVTMTHHFADDTDYLRALLQSPVRYLGVLGPRQRTERILSVLRAEGPVDDTRIYGPVGLDIGTDGAEQVALAVVAELLAVRSGRRPQSLRERRAPIHLSAD
jgi:xanthine/CO dehydrogenase XdhC/CoxF family maturation factor